jgi:hypothetical protein
VKEEVGFSIANEGRRRRPNAPWQPAGRPKPCKPLCMTCIWGWTGWKAVGRAGSREVNILPPLSPTSVQTVFHVVQRRGCRISLQGATQLPALVYGTNKRELIARFYTRHAGSSCLVQVTG